MKVLILCTGNSCRSQMAHGYLQTLDKNIEVRSAGTEPALHVNSKAVKVMSEEGIDISRHTPRFVDEYLDDDWDYVITVCDSANESCPIFPRRVKHRLHIGFEDPSEAIGTDDFIMYEFRRIRDKIIERFYKLYTEELSNHLKNRD